MYLPSIDDERTTLRNYLEVQLQAIRDASHGLTEEQARSTPLKSQLNLAGLMKHAAWCMVGAMVGAGLMDEPALDLDDFEGSFTLETDRSLDQMRELYDDITRQYLTMIEGLDMDRAMPVPPMPWYGLDEPAEAAMRYLVVHHIEEFARHAGHADIIREEIDGAKAAELDAAVAGRPANDYVTPWTPNA